jgi:hypothetical protein
MRALVDGVVEFEGRVVQGSAYPFAGENSVEIQTGNGAALQVLFNGVDLGLLGASGQVVDRIFSLQGEVTPTPTITPTAFPTEPTTPTPCLHLLHLFRLLHRPYHNCESNVLEVCCESKVFPHDLARLRQEYS